MVTKNKHDVIAVALDKHTVYKLSFLFRFEMEHQTWTVILMVQQMAIIKATYTPI